MIKLSPKALAFVFVLSYCCACAALKAEQAGPCPPTDLAAIEARFVLEATRACHAEGAKTLAECKAYPAIRDKYRSEREAYVECKP